MSYELSKKAVERLGENNVILTDKWGVPSVMVRVPKLRMCDLIPGGSENVHPAFFVGGEEVDEIYISKYANIVVDGKATSIPMEVPETGISYSQAKEYSEAKGDGWHLMTNAEYSLMALLSLKLGTLPKGNVDGELIWGGANKDYSHNGEISGVFDLCGNAFEWVSGLRLNDGQIQVIIDNNASRTGVNTGTQSTLWRTINTDGTYGERDEIEDTFFFDYKGAPSNGGTIDITDTPVTPQDNPDIVGKVPFKELDSNDTEILVSLELAPKETQGLGKDTVTVKTEGVRLARRGGDCASGENAGIFNLDLTLDRDSTTDTTGFRCCYIKP